MTNITEGGQRQNNYKQNNYRQNNYKQNSYRQSNYKDTRNTGNKETRFNKNVERKDNSGRNKDTKVRERIPCRVCSKTTHENLLGCPEFQKYIPGQPGGSVSIPKEVCLKCLGTVFRNCMHNSLRYYKKYFCNIGQKHFIICKCKKHENAHDWMRLNYNPKKGLKNMDKMYN